MKKESVRKYGSRIGSQEEDLGGRVGEESGRRRVTNGFHLAHLHSLLALPPIYPSPPILLTPLLLCKARSLVHFGKLLYTLVHFCTHWYTSNQKHHSADSRARSQLWFQHFVVRSFPSSRCSHQSHSSLDFNQRHQIHSSLDQNLLLV